MEIFSTRGRIQDDSIFRSSNQKADIVSRCSAFASKEGGTTAAGNQMLLRKEHWLEIRAMQIDDEDYE